MSALKDLHILVGVTGGIAAYKTCELVRLLQKAGADVSVVMTENATRFVGAATFRALTRKPVAIAAFEDADRPVKHISLAQSADLFIIAPATANCIAKLAHGVADDLLTTTAVAAQCPLLLAPAMNTDMWTDDTVQHNLGMLAQRGIEIIKPDEGYLACGDVGAGRMAEPTDIFQAINRSVVLGRQLEGTHVLITAGPTREPLDPVRYLTNHSSGKMGYALAKEALARGASVTVVSGPVNLPPVRNARMVYVTTAEEMNRAVQDCIEDVDIAVFAAAVADYRPASASSQKIKKGPEDELTLTLVKNPDIIEGVVRAKAEQRTNPDLVIVGFAAETDNVVEFAAQKLRAKSMDLCVANRVGDGFGFNVDTNAASLITGEGCKAEAQGTKRQVAQKVYDYVASHLLKK